MKLFILLFSFCLVAAQSSPAKKMSDREFAGFIGPVKSVYGEIEITERNYSPPLIGRQCRNLKEAYDLGGQLTQKSVYPGLCGEDEIADSYKYAADGSRTRNTMEIRDKHSPPATVNWITLDIGPVREIFRYDSAGKLVETSYVPRKKKMILIISYQYDSAGRLIETRSQRSDSKDSTREIQTYEGNNKVPSTYSFISSSGQVRQKKTYSDYEFNPQVD